MLQFKDFNFPLFRWGVETNVRRDPSIVEGLCGFLVRADMRDADCKCELLDGGVSKRYDGPNGCEG